MAWFREDFWQAWQGSTVRRQVVVLHEAPENCRIMRVNPGTFFVSQHEGQQRPLPAPLVLTQWEQNELMSVPGCRKAKKRCFVKPQTAPKGTGLNTGLTFLLLPPFPKHPRCLVLGFKPYFERVWVVQWK